jgi:hypothetical protein
MIPLTTQKHIADLKSIQVFSKSKGSLNIKNYELVIMSYSCGVKERRRDNIEAHVRGSKGRQ